jgi:hypothetical protein
MVDSCPHLHKIDDDITGDEVCTDCGQIVGSCRLFHPNNQWREGVQAVFRSIYKRKHHFSERISQWLCQDRTVPEFVVDLVKKNSRPYLTKTGIRQILRKNGLQTYIENWIQIYCRVTGEKIEPPPSEIIEQMKELFVCIEVAFIKHRPKHRKSMMNYNFIFVRLLQHFHLKDHYKWFPPLKSRIKIRSTDDIWKSICGFTGMSYQPLPVVRSLR